MRVAVDTNVFAYAEGGDDARKSEIARQWLARLRGDVVMPAQVAGEFYNVLTRRFGRAPSEARRLVGSLQRATVFVAASDVEFDRAFALASEHRLQIWDALIVCTAARAECDLLLSEDMQDGFVYRGVTIADPFTDRPHPLLASVLRDLPERP